MRQLMSLILTLFISFSAFANDPEFAVAVGFRNTNVDAVAAGTSGEAGNGMQAGVLGFLPFNEVWGLRSGFLYSQRKFLVKGAAQDTSVETAYVDIPATLMFRFNEYGGAFAGILLALAQSKECTQTNDTDGCSLTGSSSSIMPITFGVSFKFAPQIGAELFYEQLGGKFSDQAENVRSVGANFVYYFE